MSVNLNLDNAMASRRGRPTKYEFVDGDRVGCLVVIGRGEVLGSHGGRWRVRCDCGRERIVYGSWLAHKAALESTAASYSWRRCGSACALPKLPRSSGPRREPDLQTLARRILAQLHSTARRRALAVTLTVEQIISVRLYDPRCWYCESELPESIGGLDRIDSDRGYDIYNVLPCCSICNDARGYLLSAAEFKAAMDHRRAQLAPGSDPWAGFRSRLGGRAGR